MEPCHDFKDKITFIDDLSPDEEKNVLAHAETCENCRTHLQAVRAISASLKKRASEHPLGDEILEQYAVELSSAGEPDYDGKRLTAAETSQIENHIAQCNPCKKKLDMLQKEYLAITEHLDEMDFPDMTLSPLLSKTSTDGLMSGIKALLQPSQWRIPALAGALAVLTVAIWFSPFFRDGEHPYQHVLALDSKIFLSRVRGDVDGELDRARIAFDQQDYSSVNASSPNAAGVIMMRNACLGRLISLITLVTPCGKFSSDS